MYLQNMKKYSVIESFLRTGKTRHVPRGIKYLGPQIFQILSDNDGNIRGSFYETLSKIRVKFRKILGNFENTLIKCLNRGKYIGNFK